VDAPACRQATIDHLIVGADQVTTVPADATPLRYAKSPAPAGTADYWSETATVL
jgi:hypothetical protein